MPANFNLKCWVLLIVSPREKGFCIHNFWGVQTCYLKVLQIVIFNTFFTQYYFVNLDRDPVSISYQGLVIYLEKSNIRLINSKNSDAGR